MITIRKLKTLPHQTRLRKTVSILAHLELRETDLISQRRYLGDLMGTVTRDRSLPLEIRDIARSLVDVLDRAADRVADGADLDGAFGSGAPGAPVATLDATIRRAVNTLRHEMNAFLGRSSADWDVYDSEVGGLDASRRIVRDFFLYLEDLRSPFNVGAVFRAAESFGVRRIFISPHTADPEHPRARRASMSTTGVVPWERLPFQEAHARAGEPHVFALETGGTAVEELLLPEPGLMVIGSEELGVSPEVLAAADASAGRLSIVTGGVKGSLNVAVAAGIAMHAWWSQRRTRPSGE
ncbi:MAG: TrmH family RNA methyltransferase [Spirochaetota bacterium]